MGLQASGKAAKGHQSRAPRGIRSIYPNQKRRDTSFLRSFESRSEREDASYRLSASSGQSLASRFGYGHFIPRYSTRIYRWRAPREISRVPTPNPLCTAQAHHSHCSRIGSLPCKFHPPPTERLVYVAYSESTLPF